MYAVTMMLAILFGILFIYSLYCLIDLLIFKAKTVATAGRGTTKHINLYRLLLRLKGGKGPASVPDILFRAGIAIKVDMVITIISLIATIILIGVTATLSIFNNSAAAIIRNNHAIIQERREESSDDWVDSKDDDRHDTETDESSDSTESTESTSENSDNNTSEEDWVDNKDDSRH